MALNPLDQTAAFELIRAHERILVIPHANVDPDGLSSALACFQVFQKMGKDVTVICPDTLPEMLSFLPGFEKLEQEIAESQNFIVTINLADGVEVDKLRYTVEDQKVNIIVVPKRGKISSQHISFGEGEKRYDLIVVVDTADLSLLGSLYTDHVDLFSDIPILNIDHHISNSRYGQMQLIDPTAASATEVLYNWFKSVPEWQQGMTPDLATLLLTGLITDTRSFQNPNTTPRSLEVAAELLERGARQQEIIQHIYKTKPLTTLKIWGRALNHIQIDAAAHIVWSAISKEDLQEMEATSKETAGILDELISTIPDADVHVLFTEVEEGGFKASMRSSAAVDVSRLAGETYGGGGHSRAAGFRVRSYDNFQLQVLECIKKL
ncbi:MAG: phosphoesterase RecJ protein, partial [Candidatus Peribacteria bacterium]|nr:phosphoesterase RecJ protein [Candidatus Peribacteria bacterium]